MQAIILAAGMGKRLKELTNNNTKCMVKVNGVSLIDRMLSILDKKQLSRIVIVIGYKGQELKDYILTLNVNTPICFIDNPIYDKTNNIYSLALAKDYLESEDSLLLESDIIFEENLIDCLLDDERPTLALVDKYKAWMDGTCLVLNENDKITDFITGKKLRFEDKDIYYKTVNIYKFSASFSKNIYVPFLQAYSKAMGNNEYYESVIKLIAILDNNEICAKRLEGQLWYEIDDVQDLDIAESLFADDSKDRYETIMKRYGGFWRYTELLDFCYLVNPYFPPAHLLDEIKSNFDVLAMQYPSGQQVNSLLAGKYFGIDKQYIAVGNGAAEIIKDLFSMLSGSFGFIRPSFEEYINRCPVNKRVIYNVTNQDFSYGADDIISYFSENPVDNIVLINPDNPSGNYISYENVIKLADYCKEKGVKLVLDESFIDFSEENGTLLCNENLEKYGDNLIIIKSISKSFGVPGFRLGIICCGDTDFMSKMKKELSIWNINSFGEYFMQIIEKYKADYNLAIKKNIEVRADFEAKLKECAYLKVFPSQANYFMCQVMNISAEELCCYMLEKNILIKNLTGKINNGSEYIRIAVRSKEDNDILVKALIEYGK